MPAGGAFQIVQQTRHPVCLAIIEPRAPETYSIVSRRYLADLRQAGPVCEFDRSLFGLLDQSGAPGDNQHLLIEQHRRLARIASRKAGASPARQNKETMPPRTITGRGKP